jgi:hypothetical protein
MRRRIRSRALRERFDKAWSILPDSEQQRLRSFIRYVDETDVLEGTFVYGRVEPGGDVEMIAELGSGVGFAAFMSLASGDVADVILPSNPLTTCGEAPAVAVILHELAHVVDQLDRPDDASARSRERSEMYAWSQALAWACSSSLNDQQSSELVGLALSGMREDTFRRLLG